MPISSGSAWAGSCCGSTAGADQLLFEEHVELQQLFIAQLLPAGQLKVPLEQLTSLAGVPAQACQQLIALAEQIAAAQRNRRLAGITAVVEAPQGAQIGKQVGVGGEAVAAGMSKGPLEVDGFLAPVPGQALQLHVQFSQFIAPVVRIRLCFLFLACDRRGWCRRRRCWHGALWLGAEQQCLSCWAAALRLPIAVPEILLLWGRRSPVRHRCRAAPHRCRHRRPRRCGAGLQFARLRCCQPLLQPLDRTILRCFRIRSLAEAATQTAAITPGAGFHHPSAWFGMHQPHLQHRAQPFPEHGRQRRSIQLRIHGCGGRGCSP